MKDIFTQSWVPVLMYHSVSTAKTDWHYTITPQVFESQLKFLQQRGYKGISLSRLLEAFEGEAELPPKSIVITFDDGYVDNYTYAWSLLKKYGFTATIFLVSDYIGMDNSFDLHRASNLKMLNRSQILEMAQSGIEFGSHTATHKALPFLTVEERAEELIRSRANLAAILDREVKFFAYPHSKMNKACEEAVAEAGYKLALAGAGPNFKPYNINRIELFETNHNLLSLKIMTSKHLRNLRKNIFYIKARELAGTFAARYSTKKPGRK